MGLPTKINYKIYQGSTFTKVLRWETLVKKFANISAITKSAPTVVSAIGHGIPPGWRFKVSSVTGMKEINTEDYLIATSVDTDSVTIGDLNSLSYSTYVSGGVLEYYEPKNLAAFSARMQIREKLSSTDVFLELTDANGGVIIDNVEKTITIVVTPTQTELFVAKNYVYSLEMYTASEVHQLVRGTLTTDFEITR